MNLRTGEANTCPIDGGPDAELEPGVEEGEAEEQHVPGGEKTARVGQRRRRRHRRRPVIGRPDSGAQRQQQHHTQGRHAQQHNAHQVSRGFIDFL